MHEHEVIEFRVTYYSEEGGLPTLWDNPGEGRDRAVVLKDALGNVEIHTNPDTVTDYLGES